ncbi:hypothetical protein ACWF82_19405 [Nocardia sp. NPDC055053]
MNELDQTTQTLLAGPRRNRSVDTLALRRDESGAVVSSIRLGMPEPGTDTIDSVTAVIGTLDRWSIDRTVGLQSAIVTTRQRKDSRHTSVLARLETALGPVLVGSATTADPAELSDAPGLAAPPKLPNRLVAPPTDWVRLPLCLRPEVAAVLISGAGFSLLSAKGTVTRQTMTGRKLLPGLTLTEVPVWPAEGTPDDLGGTATAVALIENGRVLAPDPAPRLVWNHDLGATAAPIITGWRLTGPEATEPSRVIELVHCVEGLQRYHSRGWVRLTCLARESGRDAWFSLTLTARPIHLLRCAIGTTGPASTVYTDAEVTTSTVLLPSAETLNTKDRDVITVSQP